MKQYTAKNIRNVALAGHAGSGKPRWPRPLITCRVPPTGWAGWRTAIPCATSIRRKSGGRPRFPWRSLPVEWKDTKMNLLDTPGLF